MRCKIAVWQDAYKSVRQTQRLFNRKTKERTLRGKHSGFRRGICI